MANEEQLKLLRQGVVAWNAWRKKHPNENVDLTGATLSGARLSRADLIGANLSDADLSGAHLSGADLSGADLNRAILSNANLVNANLVSTNLRGATLNDANLRGATLNDANLRGATLNDADLIGAYLMGANLRGADLVGANLRGANLDGAKLRGAELTGAILTEANLYETVFGNTNLRGAEGLEKCVHKGPSTIDHRTIERSGPLPLVFLRGCGLPDTLIDYLPSLLNQPIQFYSCFVSYSSKDDEFAKRIHADLQAAGVRCWFAPEDMKIGDKIRTRIDEVIHIHDKLLLVFSKDSMVSDWVENEVETAFEKEAGRKTTVLFPIRLDDTVLSSETGWAATIKRTRHIGDFANWKDHDAYQLAFQRLLRDLKVIKDDEE